MKLLRTTFYNEHLRWLFLASQIHHALVQFLQNFTSSTKNALWLILFFSMILNFLACFVGFFLLMQTCETSNSSLVKSSPSRFYIFTFSICAMAFIADCTLNHYSAILLIYTPLRWYR